MRRLFVLAKGAFGAGRFGRFVLAGIANTSVSYGVYCLFVYLGIAYYLAAVLGAIVSLIFNFHSISIFVFGRYGGRFALRYAMVFCLSLALNIGGIKLLSMVGMNYYISSALVAGPVAILSFFLYKRFVFSSD
jgi:putative flippase GtrA